MAVVASRRAINIPADARVVLVSTRLGVRTRRRMAGDAGKLRIVRRDLMAIRADRRCTPRWVRKLEEGMVENCAQPSRSHPRIMTTRACSRV